MNHILLFRLWYLPLPLFLVRARAFFPFSLCFLIFDHCNSSLSATFCVKLHGNNVFKMFTVYPGNQTQPKRIHRNYSRTRQIVIPIPLIWQQCEATFDSYHENERNQRLRAEKELFDRSENFTRTAYDAPVIRVLKLQLNWFRCSYKYKREERRAKKRTPFTSLSHLIFTFIESVRFGVSKRADNRLSISSFFFSSSRVKRWRTAKFCIRLRKKSQCEVQSNGGDRR